MNKSLTLTFTLSLVVMMMITAIPAQNEATTPYEIWTASDFSTIRDNLGGSFILMDNITLTSVIDPIGTGDTPFYGTFDGNHKTITGLTITKSNYVGLFGKIGPSGMVSDLRIKQAVITADNTAGILVGYNFGTINNVHVSGTLTINEHSGGGLIGMNKGTVTDCSSTNGIISLTDNTNAGFKIAGLIGGHTSDSEYTAFISNSYSTFDVNTNGRDWNIGGYISSAGLIGEVKGSSTITNCYASGNITITSGSGKGGLVGGTSGTSYTGTTTHSYYNIELGITTSLLGTGKTNSEMKTQLTYTDWDFIDTWSIEPGESYPYLQSQALFLPVEVPEDNTTDGNTSDDGNVTIPDLADYDINITLPFSGLTDLIGIDLMLLILAPVCLYAALMTRNRYLLVIALALTGYLAISLSGLTMEAIVDFLKAGGR